MSKKEVVELFGRFLMEVGETLVWTEEERNLMGSSHTASDEEPDDDEGEEDEVGEYGAVVDLLDTLLIQSETAEERGEVDSDDPDFTTDMSKRVDRAIQRLEDSRRALEKLAKDHGTLMTEHERLKKHVAELDKKADARIAKETEELTSANAFYRNNAADHRRETDKARTELAAFQEGWKKYQDKASAEAKRVQFLEGELIKERVMVEEFRTKYHDADKRHGEHMQRCSRGLESE